MLLYITTIANILTMLVYSLAAANAKDGWMALVFFSTAFQLTILLVTISKE